MREIPNAYGAPPARVPSRIGTGTTRTSDVEEIQDLSPVERQGVNAFLKSADEEAKGNVGQALRNFRIQTANQYECPPIGVGEDDVLSSLFEPFFRLQHSLEKMVAVRSSTLRWTDSDKR